MPGLDVLERLVKGRAAGPTASFTELHLAEAIDVIGREQIGRLGLSRRLGLGEGTTRTLIDRLLEARLIKISNRGCELTGRGLSIMKELDSKLGPKARVPKSRITVGPCDFGILVRNAANKVSSGIEQRDAAVRAGANGAVTLLFKDDKLLMPTAEGSKTKQSADAVRQIVKNFRPEENGVIMIAGGDTERLAENGAWAAAWILLKS